MLQPGTVIEGRYQVIRLLGQGGMSNIYVCHDTHLRGKIWVIKEFTARYSDPQEQQVALAYFEREAHILSTLSHPNLPTVNDYFRYQGLYYFVMEYVEGVDLGKMLEQNPGPQEEKMVAEWAVQVATVMYYLHCQKPNPIIFRDIKPSNIIINRGQVKLIDFGIARHFRPEKKGDTMRIGSPGYAPPEQYNGQSDPRSDIYALGATMHQALTGIDPTASPTPFIFKPVREANPKISEAMAAIVAKAIKTVPEERYQSMVEMKRELRALLQPNIACTMPASAQPAIVQASQDLAAKAGGITTSAGTPTPSATPTPVVLPSGVVPPLAVTSSGTSTTSNKANAPSATKATLDDTGTSSSGCFHKIKVTFITILVIALIGALAYGALRVRANILGINFHTSLRRLASPNIIVNTLTFTKPLPGDTLGAQLYLNGAPYPQCLEALQSENATPQNLIYMQNCQIEDSLAIRLGNNASTSMTRRGISPDKISRLAVLIVNSASKAPDLKKFEQQCLVGTSLAQRYLNDNGGIAGQYYSLYPQHVSLAQLSSAISDLAKRPLRQVMSHQDYKRHQQYANGAIVFYATDSDSAPYLQAITTGARNLNIPIYAIAINSTILEVSAISDNTTKLVARRDSNQTPPGVDVKLSGLDFQSTVHADTPQSLQNLYTEPKRAMQATVAVSPFHTNRTARQAYALYAKTFAQSKDTYFHWPEAFDGFCLALSAPSSNLYQGLTVNYQRGNEATSTTYQTYLCEQKSRQWHHATAPVGSAPANTDPASLDPSVATPNISNPTDVAPTNATPNSSNQTETAPNANASDATTSTETTSTRSTPTEQVQHSAHTSTLSAVTTPNADSTRATASATEAFSTSDVPQEQKVEH